MKAWNAVIVGGGVAGAAAAVRLAQQNQRVLLLEKETGPHDKVCGEFISAEAARFLGSLGLDPSALGGQRITALRLVRNDKVAAITLPFEGLSLSRRALDETMLIHAERCGAEIRRGAKVTAIEKIDEKWRVKVSDEETIITTNVFLATGKHDLRGWNRTDAPQEYIGFKLHYRLVPAQQRRLADHVEMVLFDGGYAGLEPVEDGKANLCLIVTRNKFAAHAKNWDRLLTAILNDTPPLVERLGGATPCWPKPLAISGIPYGFVYEPGSADPEGFYRLGDQMAVVPSLFGQGMNIALHTAFLAVHCHMRGRSHAYHAMARDDISPLIRRTSRLARLAKYGWIQKKALDLFCARPDFLIEVAKYGRIARV